MEAGKGKGKEGERGGENGKERRKKGEGGGKEGERVDPLPRI